MQNFGQYLCRLNEPRPGPVETVMSVGQKHLPVRHCPQLVGGDAAEEVPHLFQRPVLNGDEEGTERVRNNTLQEYKSAHNYTL